MKRFVRPQLRQELAVEMVELVATVAVGAKPAVGPMEMIAAVARQTLVPVNHKTLIAQVKPGNGTGPGGLGQPSQQLVMSYGMTRRVGWRTLRR
jgi:hypothetical protein